jgi:hypothetical protein
VARPRACGARSSEVDWRCHPEVAGALAFALLKDCHEEVREEAAETLAKKAVCLPVVHMALTRAASCDPDGATRRKARRGLRNLAGRCESGCTVCDPGATPVVLPGPGVIAPAPGSAVEVLPPVFAPGASGEPAGELVPAPPVESRVEPAPPTDLAPLPPEAEKLQPGPAARRSPPRSEEDSSVPPLEGPVTRRSAGKPRVASFLPGLFRRPGR